MKKIILCLLVCMCIQVMPVRAANIEKNNNTTISEQKEERGFLEELHYRFFEKDTKDIFDYILLAILIVGILIILVLKNTHYYVVRIPNLEEEKFLEDSSYDIEQVKEIKENAEVLGSDFFEEETTKEEESEILSSDLLEDDLDVEENA